MNLIARPVLLCAFLIVAACSTAPKDADLFITHVTVYSGDAPASFVADIAVKDGKIACVGAESCSSYRAADSIDGEGLYLTPGLWDMHAHVADSVGENLDVAAFRLFGVTSIRDAGGFPELIAATRAAIVSGARTGPTIYSVGPTLNGEQFAPFQRELTTADEVKAAVGDLADASVDMIKIHRAFKPALLPVVIEAAHERGLKVTGHIPLGVAPLQACESGMDGIEHLGSFLEAYISTAPKGRATADAALAYMESDEAAPLYACLAEREIFVTPTLVVYPAVGRSRFGDGPPPDEFISFIAAMGRIALRLHRSGVPLLAGTDAASTGAMEIAPGLSLLDELEMLQSSGIPAADIIAIGTSNAAKALGVETMTGSIAPGKDADFLLLDADPGADVANFRKLRTVYRAGERIAQSLPGEAPEK